MTTKPLTAELGRIRKELAVLDLAERLWPLEPRDAALRDDQLAREVCLRVWVHSHAALPTA